VKIHYSIEDSDIERKFVRSAKTGFRRGAGVFLQLSGIMIPVYVLVAGLKQTALFDYLGGLFQPLMRYFGLPGEAALAIVTGTVVNLYAAAAVAVDLHMSVRQVTVMALILGISHSQVMETAIVGKMHGRPIIVTTLRIVFSLIGGLILNLAWPS